MRNEGDRAEESSGAERTIGRRTCLKFGTVALLTAGMSGFVGGSTQFKNVQFENKVNIVDEYGADPEGKEPVNEPIRDAAREGTLVEFPAGTYQLNGRIDIRNDRVGFLGTGDVRFRLPDDYRGDFLLVNGADEFVFVGIDVDMRGNRSGGMKLHCPTRFHVEDVEYLGRGAGTGTAFNLALTDDNGTGVLRNARVKQGGRIDGYNEGDGRIGIWAGWNHAGTLRVEHCDFREFGNNGMYTGRTLGNVQVTGCYFENNSPASVRISGKNSYVEDTTVRLDLGAYTAPTPAANGWNARGVVIDGKKSGRPAETAKPAGAEIRNCTFEYLDTGEVRPRAQGVIDVWGTARSLTVRNTTIRLDTDDIPAVRRETPGARGDYRRGLAKPPRPWWVRLDDVVVTGSAANGETVSLTEAHGSEVRNSCLHQGDRDGVRLEGTENALLDSVNIDVGGTAIRTSNSTVETRDVTHDTTCSRDGGGDGGDDGSGGDSGGDDGSDGDSGGGDDDGGDSGDGGGGDNGGDNGDGSGDDSSGDDGDDPGGDDGDNSGGDGGGDDSERDGEPEFPRQLRVIADDGAEAFTYELLVEGDAELVTSGEYAATPADGGKGETVTDNGDGTVTIEGIVANGGGDTFRFEGELRDASLDGPGTLYVDGEAVDPDLFGRLDRELQVIADDGAEAFTYELLVEGDAELVTSGEYAATPADGGKGETVTDNGDGTVTIEGIVADGGGDTFRFEGELRDASLGGAGTLYVDGEAVESS